MKRIREEFDIGFFEAKPYVVPAGDGYPESLCYRLTLLPSPLAITDPAQLVRLGSALLAQGLEWEKAGHE